MGTQAPKVKKVRAFRQPPGQTLRPFPRTLVPFVKRA